MVGKQCSLEFEILVFKIVIDHDFQIILFMLCSEYTECAGRNWLLLYSKLVTPIFKNTQTHG